MCKSVKFINTLEARLCTFSKIVQQLQLAGKKLILDCPTRWNFTYQRLLVAIHSNEVFSRYQDQEPTYIYIYLPKLDKWEKVEKIAKLLDVFNVAINVIFRSEYPIVPLYVIEVYQASKF